MHVATRTEADRKALSFAMTLSLVIGVLMFVIKMGAYRLTGSAAILSDAAESVVHVGGGHDGHRGVACDLVDIRPGHSRGAETGVAQPCAG